MIPKYQRGIHVGSVSEIPIHPVPHYGLTNSVSFFWEMDSGKLEIVDGSQRLRTLHEYVLGDSKLSNLEELSSLSGTRFSDLPPSRQNKDQEIRSIRGIVLNEHADDQARFDMFERINTGSKAANTAEVRRGALGGPFLDLVVDLARENGNSSGGISTRVEQIRAREDTRRISDQIFCLW